MMPNPKVEIKESPLCKGENKGMGCFATMEHKRGEMVGHYGGLVLRRKGPKYEDLSTDYRMDINKDYVIDGDPKYSCGNPTSYINNSTAEHPANCRFYKYAPEEIIGEA